MFLRLDADIARNGNVSSKIRLLIEKILKFTMRYLPLQYLSIWSLISLFFATKAEF